MKQKRIIHVAIADEGAMQRKGLCAEISLIGGFRIDMETNSAEKLAAWIEQAKTQPDICIYGIDVRVGKGYEILKDIIALRPLLKALVYTDINNEHAIAEMFNNGIKGHLLKGCELEELRTALASLWATGHYHSELTANILEHGMDGNKDKLKKISGREKEFLSHCCKKCSYAEIAKIMNVSYRTVEGYRNSLAKKLKMSTREQFSEFAAMMGWGLHG